MNCIQIFLGLYIIYAVNILTQQSQAGDNLHTIGLNDRTNLKPNESLGICIGDDTWAGVSELEKELNTTPFFEAVKEFYLATLRKMLKKFPLV